MICRAEFLLLAGLCLGALPVVAADRDASFMPIETAPATTAAPPAAAPPVVTTVPTPASPVLPITMPRAGQIVSAPVSTAPVTATPVPAPATAAATPAVIAKPVTAQPLAAVDPQNVGLLTENTGGLGASLWNSTPRALLDRLLPALALPTASPELNSLARRLLLSTAAVPEGDAKAINLTILRLNKLLALGDTAGAWQLAQLAKPDQIDDATLRQVVEAALLGPAAKPVCEAMPQLLAAHKGAEWQKSQIVCQVKAGDMAGAQLGFDMMREQKADDEVFMNLLDRNIFGTSKQLPRQLTPLKPLNVALLAKTGLPLPVEVYPHPDASMIEQLLQAKAVNDGSRLTLAERAAAKGLIGTTQLAGVYRDIGFPPDTLENALGSTETGARLRALVYQALSSNQMALALRADLIGKFMQASDAATLTGTAGQALADMANSIPVVPEYNRFAGIATRLYVLAGRLDQAAAWYRLAQGPAGHMADVASVMKGNWPLLVLSGLVSDADYGKGLPSWLDDALKPAADDGDKSKASPADIEKDNRMLRQQAGAVLVLFSAAGYAVPEEDWARVADAVADGKRQVSPPPVLLERLRDSGSFNRRGEAVLDTLLLSGGEVEDVPLFVEADAVRALREVGLTVEARALAREVAARALLPVP